MWKNLIKSPFLTLIAVLLMPLVVTAKPPKEKKERKKKKAETVLLDTFEIKGVDPILNYKATPTAYFDLIHTKLVLKPVLEEKILYGKATIDLKPRFYPQKSVVLDAKGMKINRIYLLKNENPTELNFDYDNAKINIKLPYEFTKKDTLRLYIDYVAQPYLLDKATVEMGRGMYFINTDGSNPYKPTHVWTQGETEAASCWFPTLDNTYQKTTQELYVTMDKKYVSFSNGLLISSTENTDGTRTDYYRQSLPHAPYLFVLAFGEYQIFKDSWRNKQVNYYTFPKYYDDVQKVFGKTPQMMEYFSTLLGVDYPWEKYDQIIAYDYTAGAMENTGASVFYEPLFSTSRDLIDVDYEDIIAHELFHQWFGDLVTCENWSQLTLNESFANYSEQLWKEHSRGKSDGDAHWYKDFMDYMREYATRKQEPIVNFYFESPDQVFDSHRYEKGGRVLHMLRKYVGDEAFFTALNIYLSKYAFKAAELDQLRLIFEEVTGEDLNWFFNQWWMSQGHPMLDLAYQYDPTAKTLEFKVAQIQKTSDPKAPIFKFPVVIEIHTEDSIISQKVWVDQKNETFTFPIPNAPVAVNFDPEKYLICQTNTYQSAAAYTRIFSTSASVLDKIFALNALADKQNEPEVKALFIKALKDPFWFVRQHALKILAEKQYTGTEMSAVVTSLVKTDPHPSVRYEAMSRKNIFPVDQLENIATDALEKDSSFYVMASALDALREQNMDKAMVYAKKLKQFENPRLTASVVRTLAEKPDNEDYAYFEKSMYLQFYRNSKAINVSFEKYLLGVDIETFKKGVALMKKYIQTEETSSNVEMVKSVLDNLKHKLSVEAASEKYIDQAAKKAFILQD